MQDEITQVAQDSARGSFFLISGTTLSTIIMAVGSILIARFLGPDLYGQYALALVFPQIAFLFTDLGINLGVTKFAAALKSQGESNRIPSIVKHGIIIRATIGIAIFLFTYIFANLIASTLFQRPELTFYIQIASIAILPQVIFTTAANAFIGLDKTEYQAITTNIMSTVKTIVSITLVLIGLSVTGAIIGFTVSYLIAAAASIPLLWLLLKENKKKTTETDSFKTNLKTLFHYGTPLYISAILTGLLPLFKNVILAFFVTDADIGNYKAAINFAALLTVLAVPIAMMLMPAFSKLNSTAQQKTKDFFKIAHKYNAIIILPITFLIIIFSNEIVQIVYGATYQLAPIFLSAYTLLYMLVGMGYLILPSLYNGMGETKTTLKISLITFITLTALAVPLTQAYGVQGIIAAFLTSHITGTLYGAYIAKKKHNIEFDIKQTSKIYLISLISSTAPLSLIYLTNLPSLLNLALGSILYLLIYITLMPLTHIVNYTELQKINLAMQNTPLLKQAAKLIIRYQQKILSKNQNKNKPSKLNK